MQGTLSKMWCLFIEYFKSLPFSLKGLLWHTSAPALMIQFKVRSKVRLWANVAQTQCFLLHRTEIKFFYFSVNWAKCGWIWNCQITFKCRPKSDPYLICGSLDITEFMQLVLVLISTWSDTSVVAKVADMYWNLCVWQHIKRNGRTGPCGSRALKLHPLICFWPLVGDWPPQQAIIASYSNQEYHWLSFGFVLHAPVQYSLSF